MTGLNQCLSRVIVMLQLSYSFATVTEQLFSSYPLVILKLS